MLRPTLVFLPDLSLRAAAQERRLLVGDANRRTAFSSALDDGVVYRVILRSEG